MYSAPRDLHSFPTRRSSYLASVGASVGAGSRSADRMSPGNDSRGPQPSSVSVTRHASSNPSPNTTVRSSARSHNRSEEHTSELQSRQYLVCRLLLEKKH